MMLKQAQYPSWIAEMPSEGRGIAQFKSRSKQQMQAN